MTHEYQPCGETDGELLPVTDFDDRFLRVATRREIHALGLLHRAVHVILMDGDGRILLQKRGDSKDHFPGWWDVSVGGHVGPDEAYLEAAVREVAEEMGIAGAEPRLVAVLPPTPLTGWEHVHLFFCRVNAGDVRPAPGEIADVRWVCPEEYLERASSESGDPDWRVTPSSLLSVRAWWENGPRR
ncbi:NUDIX domain-containing protein [Candidatus Poribacteria bacterium]|nr:NUDIX domain-containing protein [Candidatus Poribacteria bacterium]